MTIHQGPYMNEDGEWWVPTASLGYLAARRLVKEHLYDAEMSVLRYLGRETVSLDPCHAAGDGPCDVAETVEAWHFLEDER